MLAVAFSTSVNLAEAGPLNPGTDHSVGISALSGSYHLLFTIPANSNRLGYMIQNQDTTDPIVVEFNGTTQIILNAASSAGQGGGYISGTGIPFSGQIDVYSLNASAAVAAREF